MVADVKALTHCSDRIDAFCNEHDVPQKIAYAVKLSVDELLTNTIVHAERDSDHPDIEVALALGENEIVIEIDSPGMPFDPTARETPDVRARLQERPIGGLGIFFVRRVMDRFSYRREHGRNIVTLAKSLSGGMGGTMGTTTT